MARSCHPSHRLPIQELQDHVLGFMKTEPESLRSCALASRSFTSTAQSHLFKDIAFGRRGAPHDHQLAIAASHRLATVLRESPHLKRYIHSVVLSELAAVIAVVVEMGLMHLREVFFVPGPFYSTVRDTGCTAHLARLMGIQTITTLIIAGPFSPTIFHAPSPNLSSMRFFNSAPYDAPVDSPLPRTGSRPEIKQLHLALSPQLMALFLGPQCYLDFSKLTDVTISHSMSPELAGVLQAARSSIQKLGCEALDIAAIDISGFSALSEITINAGESSELLLALPTLAQLGPANVVQHVTFTCSNLSSVEPSEAVETTLEHLDAPLAVLPWPALVTVVIHMLYRSTDVPALDLAPILRDRMPAMAKIARLVATKLLLVAPRVHTWLEPLLYRVLFWGGRSGCEVPGPHRLQEILNEEASPGSTDFVERHVRHLVFTREFPEIFDILSICSGLTGLAFLIDVEPSFIPHLDRIRPTRLSINIRHLFNGSADFSRPMFTQITHLDVLDSTIIFPDESWKNLALLPCLTHLCFDPSSDLLLKPLVEIFHLLLSQCMRLQALIVLLDPRQLPDDYDLAYDTRFVISFYNRSTEDWFESAWGYADLWIQADSFIDPKRRGDILSEGICYMEYMNVP
ncbi:hypothetical protein C8J57DRAFT_1724855 [Mycena rebaudengoi]|nr:hypothetical protein C8J57DRAFT_1724855 [Mycena rebaudengoi]